MSAPLLAVENLSVSYASEEGSVLALRNASLAAQAGEAIGIVGESGCGKSTLAAALITLLATNAHWSPRRGRPWLPRLSQVCS